MKTTLLCATGLLALFPASAMGASELEELRDRCARQEQEIRELRARLAAAPPSAAEPADLPAEAAAPTPAEAPIPVARPVDEAALAAASGTTHTVISGDTFTRIATQHGVALKALMAANPTVKPTALKLGQKIAIPGTPAAVPTPSATPDAAAASPGNPSAPLDPVAPPTPQQEKIITVTIKESITYGEFAEKYGTDIQRLNSLNTLDLSPTSNLAKGSQLMVPEPKP